MTIDVKRVAAAAFITGAASLVIAATAAATTMLRRALSRPDLAAGDDFDPPWWPEFERQLEAWMRDANETP
jgi:hypothetical protein